MGVYFSSPPERLGNFLSSLHLCYWIAATGPDVFFGMGGCLDLVVLVTKTVGLASFGDLAFGALERCLGAYPLDFSGSWTPPS